VITTCRCKECVGRWDWAWNDHDGTERTSASGRPPSRVVDIIFLSLFLLYRLALATHPFLYVVTSEVADTGYSAHVYKTALLLVEEASICLSIYHGIYTSNAIVLTFFPLISR
jgi:hypothetical protein